MATGGETIQELARREYQTARAFWLRYFVEPDFDEKLASSPAVAIQNHLQRDFGAHPREAAWVSHQAFISAISVPDIDEVILTGDIYHG